MSIIKKVQPDEVANLDADHEKHRDLVASANVCASPYTDFRSGASWRIFRIMAEFIEGFEFLADLKKEVTIFGSARCDATTHYYKEAEKLGAMLAKNGFAVITGGGPGIMEAGNRGATAGGGPSIGLNIELPHEQRINPYVGKAKAFHYFFTRKVMLTASAQAYVYFPGGFGTVDELLEIITLIQTRKMCPLPIVLVGKQYWGGFVAWMKEAMLTEKYIAAEDLNIFTVVDTAEEAYELVKDSVARTYF